jgi:hypothetical protein
MRVRRISVDRAVFWVAGMLRGRVLFRRGRGVDLRYMVMLGTTGRSRSGDLDLSSFRFLPDHVVLQLPRVGSYSVSFFARFLKRLGT